jgi:hypothetical protein
MRFLAVTMVGTVIMVFVLVRIVVNAAKASNQSPPSPSQDQPLADSPTGSWRLVTQQWPTVTQSAPRWYRGSHRSSRLPL